MRKHGWWLALAGVIGLALVVAPLYAAATKNSGKPAETTLACPDAAAKTIKDAMPGATLGSTKMVTEAGRLVYAVSVTDTAGAKCVVEATYDGVLIEIETPVETKDVPEAVTKAAQTAADSGTVTGYEKLEMRAQAKDDGGSTSFVKLDKPKAAFEAELAKTDKVGRVKLDPEGMILQSAAWDAKSTSPSTSATSTSPTSSDASKKGKGKGKRGAAAGQ